MSAQRNSKLVHCDHQPGEHDGGGAMFCSGVMQELTCTKEQLDECSRTMLLEKDPMADIEGEVKWKWAGRSMELLCILKVRS